MHQLLNEFIRLRKQYDYYNETEEQLKKHFEAQLKDKQIGWVVKDNKVVAYGDILWINSIDDIYEYEKSGKNPKGDILYINNVVVDKGYNGILFDLWKIRPKHNKIAWKTKDNKFKIWERINGHYKKILEEDYKEN